MWHDIRYAVRGLLRAPVFTIVAIASLALAIGANATIFSLIDGAVCGGRPGRAE